MNGDLTQRAIETFTAPQAVIVWLQSLELPRNAMWLAVGLITTLNALVFGMSNIVLPDEGALPIIFTSPLLFGIITGTGFILTIFALFYVGRTFGGLGSLDTVLVCLIWLQSLRLVVQFGLSMVMLLSPTLSVLLAFVASLIGFWILVNFIKEFHGFASLFKATLVMIASGFTVVLGLIFVLSLLGPDTLGVTANV